MEGRPARPRPNILNSPPTLAESHSKGTLLRVRSIPKCVIQVEWAQHPRTEFGVELQASGHQRAYLVTRAFRVTATAYELLFGSDLLFDSCVHTGVSPSLRLNTSVVRSRPVPKRYTLSSNSSKLHRPVSLVASSVDCVAALSASKEISHDHYYILKGSVLRTIITTVAIGVLHPQIYG